MIKFGLNWLQLLYVKLNNHPDEKNRERVHLDTKAEMLVYAREKLEKESIQKNLETERNQANWRVSHLVQESAYLTYVLSSWQ